MVGTSDITVFRNRLYVMAAQWWYGSVFIKEENVIGGSGLKLQRLHVAGHSGELLPSTPSKKFRLQDNYVCPYMAAAVKEFLEAYGSVLVPWPSCSQDMDPIEHALDDFRRAIINRDNLPLTLHVLVQAPTKDSHALDIEPIGNLADSVM